MSSPEEFAQWDHKYAEFVQSRSKNMGSLKMDILHMAVGISGEAGEALDTAKKMWVYEQSLGTLNKEGVSHCTNLIEEAGDVLFYLQGLCNFLGVTLEEIAEVNQTKLTKRYPQGYTDAAAAKRADKEGG